MSIWKTDPSGFTIYPKEIFIQWTNIYRALNGISKEESTSKEELHEIINSIKNTEWEEFTLAKYVFKNYDIETLTQTLNNKRQKIQQKKLSMRIILDTLYSLSKPDNMIVN